MFENTRYALNSYRLQCLRRLQYSAQRFYQKNVSQKRVEEKQSQHLPINESNRIKNSVINNENIQLDQFQTAHNEPVYSYLNDSEEFKQLKDALNLVAGGCVDVPIIIGDKEFRTQKSWNQVMPHNKHQSIAKFYYADEKLIELAIDTAVKAQKQWDSIPFSERFKIWKNVIDLMQNKYRYLLNATTMLGQAKTVIQAEIDSAAELIDFFTFNAHAMRQALSYQPISINAQETLNTWVFRGMEGFVAAITPFNFTAIAGNLAYTPALAGNAVVWKPTNAAMLSNYYIFKVCQEAGVPKGVVNFVPADGPTFGNVVVRSKYLAAFNFTGSTQTFQLLWKMIASNLNVYKNFPRMIGECGGKNYHLVCTNADILNVINGTIRSAYEYSGQKCSACSRLYVPESLWPTIKEGLVETIKTLKIGPPTDFSIFTSAVIDEKAFMRIKTYIDYAKSEKDLKIIVGGECDDSIGYFIKPTLVQTKNPTDKLMKEEIFGPVLTVFVYKQNEFTDVLEWIKESTYALTGAVYSQDEDVLKYLMDELKYTAGNLYINDKSTGSVVGQQPFGGSRLSGTNDKAGGPHYVLRFTNPLVVKESFIPLNDINYPYMIQK